MTLDDAYQKIQDEHGTRGAILHLLSLADRDGQGDALRSALLVDFAAAALASRLAHMAEGAVIVDGCADGLVDQLLDEGWTWADGEPAAEVIAGKRVRYLRPPPPAPEGGE